MSFHKCILKYLRWCGRIGTEDRRCPLSVSLSVRHKKIMRASKKSKVPRAVSKLMILTPTITIWSSETQFLLATSSRWGFSGFCFALLFFPFLPAGHNCLALLRLLAICHWFEVPAQQIWFTYMPAVNTAVSSCCCVAQIFEHSLFKPLK